MVLFPQEEYFLMVFFIADVKLPCQCVQDASLEFLSLLSLFLAILPGFQRFQGAALSLELLQLFYD